MNRTRKILFACGVVAILATSFASSTQAFGGRHRNHGRSNPGSVTIYPSRYVSPGPGSTPPRANPFGYGIGYGKPSIAVRF
jgi:hypothetical protein